jgi:hypothetical protein
VALITDQTMPGLSGVELAQAALALCPSLGVIICTGYSEYIDAESARQMGVRHFLRKPSIPSCWQSSPTCWAEPAPEGAPARRGALPGLGSGFTDVFSARSEGMKRPRLIAPPGAPA